MMDKNELKRAFCAAVDARADAIKSAAADLLRMPELGFKETKTAAYMADAFRGLGIEPETGLGVTGVRGKLAGGSHNARIALIGELDAVTSPAHPMADASTGAAHSCGHNIQLAGLLGCAAALRDAGIMPHLGGDVDLLCTPAEEFVELEYRAALRDSGKIGMLSGKQELLRLGAFEGVDAAMMVHSQASTPERKCFVAGGALGFVAKIIRFSGKAAHACTPEEGVNALNAAMAAMMCIHAMRETFRAEDRIKVHPIITKGGDLVNIVPSDVVMETYVRGATPAAVKDACEKVDRAIRGAAYAIGCDVEIRDLGGYAPLRQDETISGLFADNSKAIFPEAPVITGVNMVGSTDMGDLSCVLPVIQPTIGGFTGAAHSKEFSSVDDDFTVIGTAKLLGTTAIDLLFGDKPLARTIRENYHPAE